MNERTPHKPSVMSLIDAAERLIAAHGPDGVSLQQIAEHAGQANKFAVQYHFGSRQGLIDAVFAARLPGVNARRDVQLREMKAANDLSIRSLWWALFRPILEEVDDRGRHAFARFAAQIVHVPDKRTSWFGSPHLTTGTEVYTLLRQKAPHLSVEEFQLRFMLVVDMFLIAIKQLDENVTSSRRGAATDAQLLLTNVVDIGAGALQAPASTQLLEIPRKADSARASYVPPKHANRPRKAAGRAKSTQKKLVRARPER